MAGVTLVPAWPEGQRPRRLVLEQRQDNTPNASNVSDSAEGFFLLKGCFSCYCCHDGNHDFGVLGKVLESIRVKAGSTQQRLKVSCRLSCSQHTTFRTWTNNPLLLSSDPCTLRSNRLRLNVFFLKKGTDSSLTFTASFLPSARSKTGFQTVVPSGGLPQSTGGSGRGVQVSQLIPDVSWMSCTCCGGRGGGTHTSACFQGVWNPPASVTTWKNASGTFQKRIICSDNSHSLSSKGLQMYLNLKQAKQNTYKCFGKRTPDCFFYCFKCPEEQFISIRPHADAHLMTAFALMLQWAEQFN